MQTDTRSDNNAKIRELNDALRTNLIGGTVVMTAGVAALNEVVRGKLLTSIRAFYAFSEDNDPYTEHDFGAVEIEGERYFFKIDYYDLDMRGHSPDAADPNVTARVMTIMRADEY